VGALYRIVLMILQYAVVGIGLWLEVQQSATIRPVVLYMQQYGEVATTVV